MHLYEEDVLLYLMLFVIWYYLYDLKNMENTHGGVLLLVKLLASSRIFTKSITHPRMFFMFFKLYKWYQITQNVSYFYFLQLTEFLRTLIQLIWHYLMQSLQFITIKKWNQSNFHMAITPHDN